MQIRQDPISKLYCRNDGAVLMPPSKGRFKSFRWTFGSNDRYGYKQIGFHGKKYKAHQIICRAFHGLPPVDKPFVDHINRAKDDNRPDNLHWVSCKENNNNHGRVLDRVDYGVRECESKKAYDRAYVVAHREKSRAWSKAWRERHKVA